MDSAFAFFLAIIFMKNSRFSGDIFAKKDAAGRVSFGGDSDAWGLVAVIGVFAAEAAAAAFFAIFFLKNSFLAK